MIKRMLDTNICIYIAQQKPIEVIGHFSEYRRGEIVISSITWTEMCCGTAKSGAPVMEKLLRLWEVVAFSREAAEMYAKLMLQHPNRKTGFDRLIAAHAIVLGVPLVTNNTADFAAYQSSGLILENWVAQAE